VLLATQAFNIQRQRLALQKSLLNAAQLESSLLRKNIQPHFILNSLMSITQWIEDDPKKSIEFVESLADEFRLFAKISGKSLIPLSQDVELARYHLSIMSFRLEKNFSFRVEGDIGQDWIPPGIMHTLVENGVSHNKYIVDDVEFILNREIDEEHISFSLFTPLGKKRKQGFSNIGSGTGTKYISSQLEQAYGVDYQLLGKATETHWLTTISIPIKDYRNKVANTLNS
jgi:LytS/YehU family sensor histidine kinase